MLSTYQGLIVAAALASAGCQSPAPPPGPPPIEDLFPDIEVREASVRDLSGPLVSSRKIVHTAVAGDRVVVSTDAHVAVMSVDGDRLAQVRGTVLDTDPVAERFLVVRGDLVEIRSLATGDLLASHTIDAAGRTILTGGLARDTTGMFWLGVEDDLIEMAVLVFAADGQRVAERLLTEPELRLEEGVADPVRAVITLREQTIVAGTRERVFPAPVTWFELSSPERNRLADATGRPLATLPSGAGFLTALGGVVREYDAGGNQVDLFDAPWQSCAPLSDTLLACETDSRLDVYFEGQWTTPVASIDAVERMIAGEGSVFVRHPCSEPTCIAASVISAAEGSVESVAIPELIVDTSPVAWTPAGTTLHAIANGRGLDAQAEGTIRRLLVPGLADGASPNFVAILSLQNLYLFDAGTGEMRADIPIADELFWNAVFTWDQYDYPGDGTESARLSVTISPDERAVAVIAARPDTNGTVDGHHGRHYTIFVHGTSSPYPLLARYDQFHGSGGQFSGHLLRADGAWYTVQAPDAPVALPEGRPSLVGTYVGAFAARQLRVLRGDTGELVDAFAEYDAFSWVEDDVVALWLPDTASIAGVDGGYGDGGDAFDVPIPGTPTPGVVPERSANRRAVCTGSRRLTDTSGVEHTLQLRVDATNGAVFLVAHAAGLTAPSLWEPVATATPATGCQHGSFYQRSDWEIAVWTADPPPGEAQ